MEEILLRLICQEFDIEESYLFGTTREDTVIDPLSMMTFILHAKYDWKVASIHLFYKNKGYKKTRSALYNLLKRASNSINYYGYYKNTYESVVHGLELAKRNGTYVKEEDDTHILRGRILSKVFTIRHTSNLSHIEFLLDKVLQTEFITEGQYD